MGRRQAPRRVYEARNRVMARLYLEHGWTLEDLADAFDMSISNAHRILKALGSLLPESEKRNRWHKANLAKAQDPEFRAEMAASIRETWRQRNFSGRRRLFDDDPEMRATYRKLQREVGAAEAKRMLAEHTERQRQRISA